MEIKLWQPNNHSVWSIRYRPVLGEVAKQLRSTLQTHYAQHLYSVASIEQVDEAEINSNNFKVVGLKNGEEVSYLLRKSPGTRSLQELERSLSLMQELLSRGVPVPHLL